MFDNLAAIRTAFRLALWCCGGFLADETETPDGLLSDGFEHLYWTTPHQWAVYRAGTVYYFPAPEPVLEDIRSALAVPWGAPCYSRTQASSAKGHDIIAHAYAAVAYACGPFSYGSGGGSAYDNLSPPWVRVWRHAGFWTGDILPSGFGGLGYFPEMPIGVGLSAVCHNSIPVVFPRPSEAQRLVEWLDTPGGSPLDGVLSPLLSLAAASLTGPVRGSRGAVVGAIVPGVAMPASTPPQLGAADGAIVAGELSAVVGSRRVFFGPYSNDDYRTVTP